MALYTETVMDHFMNPRNVGEIENADGVGEGSYERGAGSVFFLFYTMRQDSQSCSSGNLLWSYSMPFLS